MLVTVTNLSDVTLNVLDEISSSSTDLTGPASLLATGGNRVRPLPYPFDKIELDESGGAVDAMELPMNTGDWRYKMSVASPMEAVHEWNQLIQAGTVSMAFAAQTECVNPENLSEGTDA